MKFVESLFKFSFCVSSVAMLSVVPSVQAQDGTVEKKKLEEKQRHIQRNFVQLIQKIEALTSAVKKDDPETARRLEDALIGLKELKITSQMEEVIKYIQSDGRYQLNSKLKSLISNLEVVMDLLTLDRASLDARSIKEVIKQLKNIKAKQAKINEKRGEGKDISEEQKELREALAKANAKLGEVSDESELKEAVDEARKDLEEAEKAMKEAEEAAERAIERGKEDQEGQQAQEGQQGQPQEGGQQGQQKSGEDAEKRVQEAIEKIEKAKKKLEDALQDNEENPEDALEAIREELRRMVHIQKKTQEILEDLNIKRPSARVMKRRLKKQLQVLGQQTIDMEKIQMEFAEEGSMTFEMAMGMILEDEMAVIEDLQQTIVNDITIFKSREVIEGLEDMINALKDLEPAEGGQGGGGQGQGQGEQPVLPGIAQIVLAHLMQVRNLKNTEVVNKMKDGEGKPKVVKSLANRQKKIGKVIDKAIEAIKGGEGGVK